MYCDKTNVNILTALLLEHSITDIVACPGSRNGTLVHNFAVNPAFSLFPVTDERSAAFVALGISQATRRPAAVCVTSGSALLNTLPAISEAFFQHGKLLVISADRPPQWIGQLDGQTIFQDGALQPYCRTFQLPEPHDASETAWCNRLINEALLSLHRNGGCPAHINVPISEPLFSFTTPRLPETDVVHESTATGNKALETDILQIIKSAEMPVLLIGQCTSDIQETVNRLDANGQLLVLPEPISGLPQSWRNVLLEELLPDYAFHPDVVIHVGENLVNKKIKLALRKETGCKVLRIEEGDAFPDTFRNLHALIRCDAPTALKQLAEALPQHSKVLEMQRELSILRPHPEEIKGLPFSDLEVMRLLSRKLSERKGISLHLANSSVVRNAGYFFNDGRHPVYCNRGVNGIEGSLSTAAGFSLKNNGRTFSLIGDLSFFYDNNALWNSLLKGNFRILLFNNGGGQIFHQLPGLADTPALEKYIAAHHRHSAAGLAETYHLQYIPAHDHTEADKALDCLIDKESECPVLMEVFTKTEENGQALQELHEYFTKHYKTVLHEKELEHHQGI